MYVCVCMYEAIWTTQEQRLSPEANQGGEWELVVLDLNRVGTRSQNTHLLRACLHKVSVVHWVASCQLAAVRYKLVFSSGEQVIVIHIWVSCRCGGHESVSCTLWGETTLPWKRTIIPMESFLVCGYGWSVEGLLFILNNSDDSELWSCSYFHLISQASWS